MRYILLIVDFVYPYFLYIKLFDVYILYNFLVTHIYYVITCINPITDLWKVVKRFHAIQFHSLSSLALARCESD